jgi:hypothetical protein
MWKIEYSKEVRNYLYDSYPYTESIWQMLKTLRTTPDGLPPAQYDIAETQPVIVTWQALDHFIMYERHLERRILYFFIVKPLGEEWL